MYSVRKLFLEGDIPMNCYFIERNNKCFIVDPGYYKERIIEYVKEEGLEVIGILLTHAHIDHIGALDCFPVPIYLHELEYDVLFDDYKNGFEFFEKQKSYDLDDLNIKTINEDTLLKIDEYEISVIHTPGHTIGGVCYKIGHDLYVGDTLFEGSVGRWDRPTADLSQLKTSVLKLIEEQEEYIIIHPGHGNSSTIGTEKSINQYYKEWKYEFLNN